MAENPINTFADLIQLRTALNSAFTATELTKETLEKFQKLSLSPDDSTIKRLQLQLKKFETAVTKARKALNTATKKKIPDELANYFKKEFKALKKILGAGLFGTPKYGVLEYSGNTVSFYISVPLKDSSHINFQLTLTYRKKEEGRRGYYGYVPPVPAKVETEAFISFGNLTNTAKYGRGYVDSSALLEKLKNDKYVHFPNLSQIQQQLDAEKAELERLSNRVSHLEFRGIEESYGKFTAEFETRYDMHWEYDQEGMSRSEWDAQANAYLKEDADRLHNIFPKDTYRIQGDVMDKGYASFYVQKK